MVYYTTRILINLASGVSWYPQSCAIRFLLKPVLVVLVAIFPRRKSMARYIVIIGGTVYNRNIKKFCRSCLSCVMRWGFGHPHQPPMLPIPVKGSFHHVAVYVLQYPLDTRYNVFVVPTRSKEYQDVLALHAKRIPISTKICLLCV